jgi:N6-adenosine-specific RNA methylase IME4
LTDPNIDQEFRDLIFQDDLTDEEKRELETDILVRGCVVPLIVWNGLLVDGHHRYEICKKHNIPFDVKEIEFENREYAKAWILTNQLARRNLTPYRKIELLKRRDDFLKMAEEGKRKKQISAEITNNKRWETPIEESLLSTVDKSDKNEQSKPKEKINVRDAMAKELNVSHGTIARAGIIMQKVAEGVVPPETIEKLRKGDETIGRVYKIIKTKENFEEKKKNLEEQIEHLIPTDKKYSVIVIDPPWKYDSKYDPNTRRVGADYPEMTIEEVSNIQLPVMDSCVLWLWTTNKFLHESFHIIEKWGFRYVNILTWAKDRIGVGTYLRGQTEHCILAFKGDPVFKTGTAYSTLLTAKNEGHSIKPDEFYTMVDDLCYGPKLDYFYGKKRDGWDVYGTERTR